MNNRCICVLLLLTLLQSGTLLSLAGGPLVVRNGQPVVWSGASPVIPYRLDQGRLGPLSNLAADNLMEEAFEEWESVDSATIRFTRESQDLPTDVTGENYFDVINQLDNEQLMAVIYDDDGSIVDLIFGEGARFGILGFASTRTVGNRIVFAPTAFNGFFFESRNLDADNIYSTVLHEFGHLIGLDHAQFNRHLVGNGIGDDDRFLSILYPTSSDPSDFRIGLALDDRLAISNLYPRTGFRSDTGRITGLVRRGNRSLPGVNVIARNRTDPNALVTSTVTGTFQQNGNFELEGLPPGDYEVMIESIDPNFTLSSSVGQYSETENDLSFQNPVLAEYYNANDAEDEARSLADVVSVRANQTTSSINFVVADESRDADEEDIRLLAIGSYAEGSLLRLVDYNNLFILNPSGTETGIDITFDFDRSIRYEIRLGIENSVGGRSTREISGTGQSRTLRLGDGGDAGLNNRRYFLGLTNRDQTNATFRVTVSESAPPPTPTPVPPTPTPLIIVDGDLNEDGVIDRNDFLIFARDWQRESGDRLNPNSKLSDDGLPVISPNDLLQWLEHYRAAHP